MKNINKDGYSFFIGGIYSYLMLKQYEKMITIYSLFKQRLKYTYYNLPLFITGMNFYGYVDNIEYNLEMIYQFNYECSKIPWKKTNQNHISNK